MGRHYLPIRLFTVPEKLLTQILLPDSFFPDTVLLRLVAWLEPVPSKADIGSMPSKPVGEELGNTPNSTRVTSWDVGHKSLVEASRMARSITRT